MSEDHDADLTLIEECAELIGALAVVRKTGWYHGYPHNNVEVVRFQIEAVVEACERLGVILRDLRLKEHARQEKERE